MDNDDLFPRDKQTPYDTLVELVNFCQVADQHISNLVKNQKEMVKQYNNLKHEVAQIKMRLAAWEAVVNSMAETINDQNKH